MPSGDTTVELPSSQPEGGQTPLMRRLDKIELQKKAGELDLRERIMRDREKTLDERQRGLDQRQRELNEREKRYGNLEQREEKLNSLRQELDKRATEQAQINVRFREEAARQAQERTRLENLNLLVKQRSEEIQRLIRDNAWLGELYKTKPSGTDKRGNSPPPFPPPGTPPPPSGIPPVE